MLKWTSTAVAAAAALVLTLSGQAALAASPDRMMAQCRNRAHDELGGRLPDIATKYEGQRTDGTHAVNGTAHINGGERTFQCSFNRSGRRIVQFVVNRDDNAPAAAAVATTDPASGIETRRVRFAPGSNAATVQARITGRQTVDYVLRARAGQTMNVSMATRNTATYFNILPPGENEAGMYNGSTSGNQFEGVLPRDGDYKVRVYMMRSAARRNEAADYRLEMILSGGPEKAAAPAENRPSGDALVPGTNYHATGKVSCAMGRGRPTGQCAFGVQREANGGGIVTITKPDGRKRAVFFEKGKAVGYDESQADRAEFKATRQGDTSIIHIGNEKYEIPDAVVFGG